MAMLKSEITTPTWVPEGYRKLGWHAGFDVLIGPMYYKKNELGEFKFISKILDKQLNAHGMAHGGFSMSLTDFSISHSTICIGLLVEPYLLPTLDR